MSFQVAPFIRDNQEVLEQTVKASLGSNWQLVSLSVYGNPQNPRFAHVWVRRPYTFPEQRVGLWAEHEVEDALQEQLSDRFMPILVSAASRPGYESTFAFVLEKQATKPFPSIFEWGLTTDSLTAMCNAYRAPVMADSASGRRYLRSIAHYRDDAEKHRFAATFHIQPYDGEEGNGEFLSWNVQTGDTGDALQRKFEAYVAKPLFVRPDFVLPYDAPTSAASALLPGQRLTFASIWHDNRLPRWSLHHELTLDGYESKRSELGPLGLFPIRIQGNGSGSSKRYSVLFADTDQPISRTWRVKGLYPSVLSVAKSSANKPYVDRYPPGFAAVRGIVRTEMEKYGIRGAQVAITHGGRLVYAEAFTLAEPDYADIEVDTTFCLASVSKALTATAALLTVGKYASPVSQVEKLTLGSVLGSFVDYRFDALTLRQCIRHTTGLGGTMNNLEAFKYVGAGESDPLEALVAYIRERPNKSFEATLLGDPPYYYYCGMNRVLLAAAMSRIHTSPYSSETVTYEQTMKDILFSPLKIKSAHIGGSHAPSPGEAIRHQMIPALTETGLVVKNWRPAAYGLRDLHMVAPAGGWAMSAVDSVLIMSALTPPLPILNPFDSPFPPSVQNAVGTLAPGVNFQSGTAGSPLITEGGWYRTRASQIFDPVMGIAQVGNFVISHNGAFEGATALLARDDRGSACAIAFNGDHFRDANGTSGSLNAADVDLLFRGMNSAAMAVGAQFVWPKYDLFKNLTP